jgi:hypothetical protein
VAVNSLLVMPHEDDKGNEYPQSVWDLLQVNLVFESGPGGRVLGPGHPGDTPPQKSMVLAQLIGYASADRRAAGKNPVAGPVQASLKLADVRAVHAAVQEHVLPLVVAALKRLPEFADAQPVEPAQE